MSQVNYFQNFHRVTKALTQFFINGNVVKVGVDASTEISDGELFDFDKEVQSILESLVGTTLQQALTEVVHEEEVADLREQQHKMLAIREAELAELRRMENKEKSLQSEKVSKTHISK